MKEDFLFVLAYWKKTGKEHDRFYNLAGQYREWMRQVYGDYWYIALTIKEFAKEFHEAGWMRVLGRKDIAIYNKKHDILYNYKLIPNAVGYLHLYTKGELLDGAAVCKTYPTTDIFPIWIPDHNMKRVFQEL